MLVLFLVFYLTELKVGAVFNPISKSRHWFIGAKTGLAIRMRNSDAKRLAHGKCNFFSADLCRAHNLSRSKAKFPFNCTRPGFHTPINM